MGGQSFVGTWRLRSLQHNTEDGQIRYPFGEDAQGYIMYSPDGYMAVAIMNPHRPRYASEDIRGGTTSEKEAAADSYVSYCGKYKVQGDRVIHHVEVSFFPNFVGQSIVRYFKLQGNLLTLTTPPFLFEGRQETGKLVWERV